MKRIRLCRHPKCQKCARISALHHRFDWLDRVDFSTEIPKTGSLRMGEIIVEELSTGRIFRGYRAFDQLCRHIPLYAPARLFLFLPFIQQWLDRRLSGCDDGSCNIPVKN